jgi:predicted PurR-regulated permease PerM
LALLWLLEIFMSSFETLTLHRLLLAVILTLLLLLGYNILAVFIIPMAWAGILAYVTWPIYSRLLVRLKQRHNLAALMMTCSLILLLVVPLLFAVVMLQSEVLKLKCKSGFQKGFWCGGTSSR